MISSVDTRLFGIFYTLNHAAYISLILFIVGIVQIIRTKKLWVRITVILANLILLCHIVLSGSRSALVALIVCMAFLGLMIGINYVKKSGWIKIMPVIFCVLFAAVSFFVYKGMKEVLPMIPYAVEKIGASDKEQSDREQHPEDYDDVLETFLLNLIHGGRLGCFQPVTYLDRTDITVIRPMIYVQEKDARSFCRSNQTWKRESPR